LDGVGNTAKRTQEKLQRGQSLLAVNDFRSGNGAANNPLHIEDDGSEEMRMLRKAIMTCKTFLCLTLDVVPERLPLGLFIPDIGALIKRNSVSTFFLKEVVN
jgi:hypothetical protein